MFPGDRAGQQKTQALGPAKGAQCNIHTAPGPWGVQQAVATISENQASPESLSSTVSFNAPMSGTLADLI